MPVPAVAVVNEAGEQTPLLHSPTAEATKARPQSYLEMYKAALQYLLCLAFVVSAGMTAWLISRHHRVGTDPDSGVGGPVLEWRSQVIGWMSAVLYRKSDLRMKPLPVITDG